MILGPRVSGHHRRNALGVWTKCDQFRSADRGDNAVLTTMSTPYYASFNVHDSRERGVTQYSGIIEMTGSGVDRLGPRDLVVLLARNLDVDCDDVEVLQWGPVH